MEAQVSLKRVDRLVGELCLHGLHELRLRNVELRNIRSALHGEVMRPVDGRRKLRQLRDGHKVVSLVRIAALDAGERRFGQRRLDAHDGVGVRLGFVCRFAGEHEHMLHIVEVLITKFDAALVGLEIVVAIWQAKPSGTDFDDHQR